MKVSNMKTALLVGLTTDIMFFLLIRKSLVSFFVAHNILLLSQMEMITSLKKKKRHCCILLVSHVLLPVICGSAMLLVFQFLRNCKCYFSSWLFHDLKLLNASPVESYLNSAVSFLWGTQLNSTIPYS